MNTWCRSELIVEKMGGAVVSILPVDQKSTIAIKEVPLRKLPDAIEEAIYINEKFPLIIDPTEQAARYWRFYL